MIRADQTYVARVGSGSRFFESTKNKTPGFQVNLECDEGTISYVIWITRKNRERAAKDFETLGVDISSLSSRNFLMYDLPNRIAGAEVEFSTKAETWNGESQVKVDRIGRPGAGNEEAIAACVAEIFGAPSGTPAQASPPTSTSFATPEPDDDIPF